MADKMQQEAVKILTSFTSISLQLQNLLLVYITRRKALDNLLLKISLKKKNYFLNKVIERQIQRLNRRPRSIWFKPGGSDIFWQNLINGTFSAEKWKKNFRLTKEKFYELADLLRPYISPRGQSPNYRSLDADKKLAVCLYYLKDTGSIWMTANTFGIHQSTVSKVIIEVCTCITKYLGPRYLRLPKTEEEMKQKVSQFELKFGMPQAFGAIDGTHIPIQRPTENSQDYYNYKGFFSISVQAVCDFRGIFMDIDCSWPGSLHDAKIFANSKINQSMTENTLPITYQSLLPGFTKIPNFLIGDPAYPLTPYVMKEYTHCTKNEEVVFNNVLRSSRNPIECAFGRLKARWSVLTKQIDLKLENIPYIVYACFVLHNYCEISNVPIDDELVQKHIKEIHKDDEIHRAHHDNIFACNTDEGQLIRNVITTYMKTCLPDHLTV